jgi:hypothetical protein
MNYKNNRLIAVLGELKEDAGYKYRKKQGLKNSWD